MVLEESKDVELLSGSIKLKEVLVERHELVSDLDPWAVNIDELAHRSGVESVHRVHLVVGLAIIHDVLRGAK